MVEPITKVPVRKEIDDLPFISVTNLVKALMSELKTEYVNGDTEKD